MVILPHQRVICVWSCLWSYMVLPCVHSLLTKKKAHIFLLVYCVVQVEKHTQKSTTIHHIGVYNYNKVTLLFTHLQSLITIVPIATILRNLVWEMALRDVFSTLTLLTSPHEAQEYVSSRNSKSNWISMFWSNTSTPVE